MSNKWITPETKKILKRFETLAGRPAAVLNTMSVAEIHARKTELALEQKRLDEEIYSRFERLTGRKPIAVMTDAEKLLFISQKENEKKSQSKTKRGKKSGGRKSRPRKTKGKKPYNKKIM